MLGGVGEVEPWDLRQLMIGWEGMERAFAGLGGADRFTAAHNQVMTARLADQSQPGGHHTYIVARQLITIAMDHHRALLAVMSQSASPCAAWTLLRSVFESSALASWVLDPTDGLERRRRAQRRTCLDFQQQRNYQAALRLTMTAPEAASVAEEVRVAKQLRAEAEELGLSWRQATGDVNLIAELAELTAVRNALGTDAAQAPRLAALWRGMSGHARGYSYTARVDLDVRWSMSLTGGAQPPATLDPEVFTAHGNVTGMLLLSAIQLYVQRSRRPLAER